MNASTETTTETVGVYGGAFDPPHCAHVLVASYVLSLGAVDRVLVVPAFGHAFGKAMAPYEHRVRLCELAFAPLRCVSVSRIESVLPVPSYTVQTLEALHAQLPGAKLRLVVGADIVTETSKWRDFARVSELAPLLVIGRGGVGEGEAALSMPSVSSTDVRARIRAKESVTGLVPRSVERYVRAHGLYT